MSNRSQRNLEGLTTEQMLTIAPSIGQAHRNADTTSERYKPAPTLTIIDGLRDEGFVPVEVQQSVPRKRSLDHAKHLIRFRRGELLQSDAQPELVLINAFDGSSSYRLLHGLFRFVCENGMISGDINAQTSVRHTGDNIMGDVIDATYRVLEHGERTIEAQDRWAEVDLNPGQRQAFAKAAALLKYDPEQVRGQTDKDKAAWVEPDQLLRPRRSQDTRKDLWTTFNVVQENLMKGGQVGFAMSEATGQYRRRRTRPVNSVDGNVRLNTALWTLAEELEKLAA